MGVGVGAEVGAGGGSGTSEGGGRGGGREMGAGVGVAWAMNSCEALMYSQLPGASASAQFSSLVSSL